MQATHQCGWRMLLAAILASFLATQSAAADDPVPAVGPSEAEQIKKLIQDWQDPSFSVRRAASQKLDSMGIPAYGPLADAAVEGDSETTQRVLEILKRGLMQPNGVTKNAAKEAVDRIAASNNSSASRAANEVRRELEAPAVSRRSAAMGVGRGGAGAPRPAPRLGQAIPQMQLIPNFPGAPGWMPGAEQGPNGRPQRQMFGRRMQNGALPQNPGGQGALQQRQNLQGLQRILEIEDQARIRDMDELARTKDAARAQQLRSSIEMHSQRRAQILDLIMRMR